MTLSAPALINRPGQKHEARRLALRRKAAHMAKLCRGLSDPLRLAILEALRSGGLTVTEIVQATGLMQSNVSNHLGCLYDCGLVDREQEGRFVRYHLSDPRVDMLLRLSGRTADRHRTRRSHLHADPMTCIMFFVPGRHAD